MSLDVYLTLATPLAPADPPRTRIFVRRKGRREEITREEWDRLFPGREPAVVIDDPLAEVNIVYEANITHNLNKMADAAGLYLPLWRPDEIGITTARQLIEPLNKGLALLRIKPPIFKALNPSNGWGDYDGLVQFVEQYLQACREWPDAIVRVSR